MKPTLKQLIAEGKTLVSDGAWGTFLQAKGLKPGECPEMWNIEHPEAVLDIARSYIEAGADTIETNSFGGTCFKLEAFGLQERVYEINKRAAEISRQAAGPDKYVLGSVGPTGKMLVMGDITLHTECIKCVPILMMWNTAKCLLTTNLMWMPTN
ncbi:MAG: homocysteine S-methyltransferase family protein [Paludibacter sp.]|jgi:5-methyltetrahydrofolate--homocysteine methyltransferase